MTTYPQRLHHRTPSWVPDTAVFHIRIRCADNNPSPLTEPDIARSLLASIQDYAKKGIWSCYLVVLMPDHLHALLSFAREPGMNEAIRVWKRGQCRVLGVAWQENYFDHRLRNRAEYSEKFAYIESNPVASGLCARPEDWPWRSSCFAAEAVPKF